MGGEDIVGILPLTFALKLKAVHFMWHLELHNGEHGGPYLQEDSIEIIVQ